MQSLRKVVAHYQTKYVFQQSHPVATPNPCFVNQQFEALLLGIVVIIL